MPPTAQQDAAEAVALLQRLIRFQTVNPPGAEVAAQRHLAEILEAAGFTVTLDGAQADRPNLVAELRAADEEAAAAGPVLGLLSHVDTVLADPDAWTRDPWGGELAGGMVWGRGAIDMKSQTAAEVTAAVSLARGGWRPARGALKVFVVVDEEVGGALGAQWLCRERPDLARCDLLLNEGAGAAITWDGGRRYGVSIGEKGVMRFRLTASGVAAHASMPGLGENALLRLAPLIDAMGREKPRFDVAEAPARLLAGLGLDPGDPEGAVRAIGERQPELLALVEPMLRVTLSPTMLEASSKINVLPAKAVLQVDCRVPPEMDSGTARERILEVLGELPDGVEMDIFEQVVGTASPVDGPLMDAIAGWVARTDPDASLVPTVMPGFTDSKSWRAAFPDVVAYGFFPQRHQTLDETWALMHAADERIDARDVGLATDAFRHITQELLG